MDISKISGAIQNSSYFYIPISHPSLTPEGMIVSILKSILDEISGEIGDELGRILTDEFGNPIGFDNSIFYPEMPLSMWRRRFITDWEEIQIVFLWREANETNSGFTGIFEF